MAILRATSRITRPSIVRRRRRRLVGPLEWLGVGIALGLDQQALADPGIGLAQGNAVRLGEPYQTFSRPVHQLGVGREGDGLLLDRGVDDHLPEVGRLGGT